MSESGQTYSSGQDPRTVGAAILPTKAHQPRAFKFPKRSFGQKTEVFRRYGLLNGHGCTKCLQVHSCLLVMRQLISQIKNNWLCVFVGLTAICNFVRNSLVSTT